MASSAHRRAVDLPSLLDKRSYRVYRLRTEQRKTFREIAAIVGLSRNRVHQIYQASVQRVELKKRGGDVWPEFSLSLRAIHCIHSAFGKTNVHKRDVTPALKRGKFFPGERTITDGKHTVKCANGSLLPITHPCF